MVTMINVIIVLISRLKQTEEMADKHVDTNQTIKKDYHLFIEHFSSLHDPIYTKIILIYSLCFKKLAHIYVGLFS